MRVLYLHQYYCPPEGWGNDRSREIASYWQKAGHEVTFITTSAYFPPEASVHRRFRSRLTINGCKVIVLNVRYSQNMSYFRRIRAFLTFFLLGLWEGIMQPRPDVIYASTTPPTVGMMGYLLARFHRRRWVLEVVDVWPDVPIGMGIIKKRWLRRMLKKGVDFLYRKADRIVALSKGMKQQITYHQINPRKIIVSPNCTNTELFHPLKEEKWNPLPIIIYAGAVGKANELSALIRAAKLLENDCVIHIYGWGAEWKRMQVYVRIFLLRNVFFFDPLPKKELAEKMRQADIGVITFAPFPVLEINSANKFFDYLASGLPVVINYKGWQADYLEEYECGLSAPQGNVEAFAEAIDQLLADRELRQKMGKNARELARAWFDRADEAEKLLQLLQETVSGKKML